LIQVRQVSVYDVAKTTAHSFKGRGRIGLDTAREALAKALVEAIGEGCLSLAGLNRYARINRVQNVMQPTIEAIVLRKVERCTNGEQT
jgi:hypothetical protein